MLVDLDGDGDLDVWGRSLIGGNFGLIENLSLGHIGTTVCSPAVPNTTGQPARIRTAGSADPALGRGRLIADRMPPGTTTLFLVSDTLGTTPLVGGVGTLCLSGNIGRFVAPGQVKAASISGVAALDLDLGAIPRPSSLHPVAPGETWSFTAWFRDTDAGQPSSNFTDAVSVTFQ